MTSQDYTGTHPFYIGMYIHINTHIYVHIYTSQKECLHIFVGSGNSSSSFPAFSCLNTLWSVVPNFSLCTVSPSMLSLYCKIILRDFKCILLRNCAAFARTILTAVLNVVALSNFPLYRVSEIALLNSMALLYFVFQAVAYMHGKGIMHRAENWVSTFSKKQ